MFELLWEFFNISVLGDSGLLNTDSRSAWSGVLFQHLSRRGPRAPISDAAASVEWPGARETWAFRQWIREEPVDVDPDSAGYQGMMGHRRFKEEDAQLGDNREEEEKTYWGEEYEAGTLGEWLLWGEEMGLSSKRKRGSVDGRPAKRLAKRLVKREAVDEENEEEELEEWEEGEEEKGEEPEEEEEEEEGDEQEKKAEEAEGENMDVEVR